jgi:cGMP-dependent protein kinase
MGGICSTSVKEVVSDTYSKSPNINANAPTAQTVDVSASSLGRLPQSPSKRPAIAVKSSQKQAEERIDAVVTTPQKSYADLKMLKKFLRSHFVFKSLASSDLSLVIAQMKLYSFHQDTLVFEQGGPADTFFIVATGKCRVVVNGRCTCVLRRGEGFGELALLHDSPRSASVRTVGRAELWGVDRLSFRGAVESVSRANYAENKAFIANIPLLAQLSDKQKESTVEAFVTHSFSAGQAIVVEDDPGDLLYIIKSGSVVCTQQGQFIRRMHKGDFFGELSLLYNSTRTATVTAEAPTPPTVTEPQPLPSKTAVVCVSLGRRHLKDVLGDKLENVIYRNLVVEAMQHDPKLRGLTKEQSFAVSEKVDVRHYAAGEVVVAAGSGETGTVRIVLRGRVRLGNEVFTALKCLYDDCCALYVSAFEAVEECDVAVLSKSQLEAAIGGEYSEVVSRNCLVAVLKQVQLFRALTPKDFQKLLNVVVEAEFPAGHVIIEEGSPASSFFIVKEGKVEVNKGGDFVRSITKLDYFGERAILDQSIRSASVVSVQPSTCWIIHSADLLSILDTAMMDKLKRRMMLQDESIELDDLICVQTLGSGMFGRVLLTLHRDKQTLYALKAVSRVTVKLHQIAKWIQLEREILLQLDHEFIMKLVRTFKDSEYVYFLTEYVNGVDLFQVLTYTVKLKEKDTQFYAVCLLTVLHYLHTSQVVYRDLKPENVVIDSEGYPKLIDFGTAKIIKERTYTVLGTPHYMAPEVMLGRGYSFSVDYWSLGVMIYEMLTGSLPFGKDKTDPYEVYREVAQGQLKLPGFISREVTSLLQQLLSQDFTKRLSSSQLLTHPWFQRLDTDALLSRQLRPPLLPRLKVNSNIHQAVLRQSGVRAELRETFTQVLTGQEAVEPEGWDAMF